MRGPGPLPSSGVAPTLLIVDDHDGFRAFARALLSADGFDVVGEAADGAAAVLAAAALDPEIMLVDIALPDFDGFEVCARVRGPDRGGPTVILTSSRGIEMYRHRLVTSSARAFIPKDELSADALRALTR